MKTMKKQLALLKIELDNVRTTKERVNEIKDITIEMAKEIDNHSVIPTVYNAVVDKYKKESKYPRRRVKAVVAMLSKFINR